MGVKMYSDIIGDKTRWYGRYQIAYSAFVFQGWSERTLLYVLFDAAGYGVACQDQSQYMIAWFNKRGEIWD